MKTNGQGNIVYLFAFILAMSSGVAFAEESPFQADTSVEALRNYDLSAEVVYHKKYPRKKRHEISLSANLYFRNDLTSTYGIGAGHLYHFNEIHSWETIHATYLSNRETLLRKQIEEKTGFLPDTEENDLFATTAYMLHPIYGKISWFGKKITHFDLYGLIGGGARRLSSTGEIKAAAVGGIGFRFYLGKKSVLRLEARDFLFREKRVKGDASVHAFVPIAGIALFL